MNREEYAVIVTTPNTLEAAQLPPAEAPRTLVYGLNKDLNFFHLYLESGLFHRVIYDAQEGVRSYSKSVLLSVADTLPDKLVYPEFCCADFCQRIHGRGMQIPFMGFSDNRKVDPYFFPKFIGSLTDMAQASPTLDMFPLSYTELQVGILLKLADRQELVSAVTQRCLEAMENYRRAEAALLPDSYSRLNELPSSVEDAINQVIPRYARGRYIMPLSVATLLVTRASKMVKAPPRKARFA